MAIDIQARPAPFGNRLRARSGIANADAVRARHTVVELANQPRTLEEAGGRMLARLRRLVGEGDPSSRS